MDQERFDIVVAGGGPGGTSTAISLAQRGYRVVLFERERFPRFHVGESLLPAMWDLWDSLGVTSRLEGMGFPIKEGANFSLPSVPQDLTFRTDEFPGFFQRNWTYHVDRARFDQVLLDRTREAGVEVREGWTVDEVLFEGSRAVGVTVHEGGDESVVHRVASSVVVDATGRACLLARRLGWRRPDPALNKLSYFTHFRGAYRPVNPNGSVMTDIHCIPGGWIWYIPLVNDVVSVGAVLDADYLREAGVKGVADRFRHAVARSERISDWVSGAEQVEVYHTVSNISYLNDSFVGDGFVLVGDASMFVDPIFSAGVTIAMRGGVYAAEAIHEGLQRGDVSAEALRPYEHRIRKPMRQIFSLIYNWYDILKRGDPDSLFTRSLRIPLLRQKMVMLFSGGYDNVDLQSFLKRSREENGSGLGPNRWI